MLAARALAASILLALAGCVTAPAPPGGDDPPAAGLATEPADLTAPTFQLLGAVARTGPAYAAGEPSVSVGADGATFVAFPGCDNGYSILAPEPPGTPTCEHGIVLKSVDGGATWERLNDPQNGRLSEDGPAANGDADVAIDSAGNVYVANLGAGGIQVMSSADGGATWKYLGNATPVDHWADRQWLAASGPGHLVVTWMGGETGNARQVAVNTTMDGGATWMGTTYLGDEIGWLGTVAFAPDGKTAYIPFTDNGGSFPSTESSEFQLRVGRTTDGGATWETIDTGATVAASGTGQHWSGVLMAPALGVTGDGHVVFAWCEDVLDPTTLTSTGSVLKFIASGDGGATWSEPRALSTRAAAIMPWVAAGAGDRFAVTYLASDVPGDTDYAGAWDVMAVVVDGAGADEPQTVETLVEAGVHQGGACTRGGLCLATGSDRALLDFFESAITPDGRLVVTYPADPVQGGKYIEIRFAAQDGGSLLAIPAQSSST